MTDTDPSAPDIPAAIREAYLRGHEDGFWNGKTTDMGPREAALLMAPYRSRDLALPTVTLGQVMDVLREHGSLAEVGVETLEQEAELLMEFLVDLGKMHGPATAPTTALEPEVTVIPRTMLSSGAWPPNRPAPHFL